MASDRGMMSGGLTRRALVFAAPSLLLAQAHRYRAMMLEAQGRTMFDLAREAGVGRPYFCRIVKFGFLAPDVVKAARHLASTGSWLCDASR